MEHGVDKVRDAERRGDAVTLGDGVAFGEEFAGRLHGPNGRVEGVDMVGLDDGRLGRELDEHQDFSRGELVPRGNRLLGTNRSLHHVESATATSSQRTLESVTSPQPMIRVCFVCRGNICRSPAAQGVMEHLVALAGLDELVKVESAATGAWHVGEAPDPRVHAVAQRRGITLHSTARHFTALDFARFDHVVAVDRQSAGHLRRLGDYEEDHKIVLLRRFQPGVVDAPDLADPLYGADSDVTVMFDHCESACAGLLVYLRTLHAL